MIFYDERGHRMRAVTGMAPYLLGISSVLAAPEPACNNPIKEYIEFVRLCTLPSLPTLPSYASTATPQAAYPLVQEPAAPPAGCSLQIICSQFHGDHPSPPRHVRYPAEMRDVLPGIGDRHDQTEDTHTHETAYSQPKSAPPM